VSALIEVVDSAATCEALRLAIWVGVKLPSAVVL